MMLRSGDVLNVGTFLRDIEVVRSGAVAPQLLIASYPWALGGIAVMGFAVLMLLWRAVVGRRPRRTADKAGT
jgi:hypothetical protein